MNGKSYFAKGILEAIYSKKYKDFKRLKKLYKNILIGIDISTGKDFSCESTFKRVDGKLIFQNAKYS